MKYGLSEKQLQKVMATLKSFPEVETAILFGSRATGSYREASDVDIVIKGENVDFPLALEIKGDFEGSDLPFFFDIVAWPTVNRRVPTKPPSKISQILPIGGY